jgi:type IV pilus assembly protein PilW
MKLLNKQVPPHHTHRRSQQGVTLIELMIALVIGLLATGAMLKVYVDSSQLYRFNEGLARIQENGRFGLEFIRRDARMAGFWGCNNEANLRNLIEDDADDHPSYLFSGITSDNDSGSNGSDSITFSGARHFVDTLRSNMGDSSHDLKVESGAGIKIRDALLISDCGRADIFVVTGIDIVGGEKNLQHTDGSGNNISFRLSKKYKANHARLHSVQQTTFCIAGGPDPAQFSLRRHVNQQDGDTCLTDGDELVEGIEKMQILMGEDTDTDGIANHYVPPDPGLDMDRVVSIRISLLAVSPNNNVTTEPAPYFFNGVSVTPNINDRYLRKVFTSTITLRNKSR